MPNPLTGLPDLKTVKGFLFPEIWAAFLVDQTSAETAELIASNATQNTNQITSTVNKGNAGSVTLIQMASFFSNNQNSLSGALTSNPISGDILFLGQGSRLVGVEVDITSIVQAGVVWARVTKNYQADDLTVDLWRGVVGAGADVNITVNLNQISTATSVDVCEFAINGGVTDQTANNVGAPPNADTGTTPNTTQANELAIGLTVSELVQNTPTNGYFLIDGVDQGVPSVALAFLWKKLTAIGAANSGCNTAGAWIGLIATFTAN